MPNPKTFSSEPNRQPYRLWYEFLKTALKYNLPVDREFYRAWHLNEIKSAKHDKGFDKWYKTHKNLFYEHDTSIKLVSGGKKAEPNTILVQIPTNYNVRRVQSDIGEIVSKHLSQSNAKFKITSNRPLQIAPFDYMRWSWQYRQMPQFDKSVKGGLAKIHEQISLKQTNRTRRLKKKRRVTKRSVKATIQTAPESVHAEAVMISKNIRKADRILSNVCKGIFPGDYSIS